MIDFTKLYLFIFGTLTIAGGLMGYVKAGSNASLIAGGVSGVLLLAAGYLLMAGKTQPGLVLGLVVSLALGVHFLKGLLATHKVMPAGLMVLLSVVGLVLTALGFLKK